MSRASVIGCGLLAAALVVGCGSDSEEDKLMKQMIALQREMVEEIEKAKPATPDAAFKLVIDLGTKYAPKMKEFEEKTKNWPKEKKEAMEKKYKSDIDALKARMEKVAKKG
jgi:hypothetical protein